MRLILWDVDGTLVLAGPAAQRAFDRAVASVLGRSAEGHGVHMSGKTDPEIALEILAALALPEDQARRHLPRVLRALKRELTGAVEQIRQDGRVLPGVPELLRALYGRPGIVQSVLTGNLRANAELKLGVFGLDRFFDLEVGAYGSDDEDRSALVPVALRRVEARYGVGIPPERVWVVGDTPRDLACARAAGARCLLVGSGRIPFGELASLEADAVLPDLTDTAGVLRLLLGPDRFGPQG